MIEVASTVPGRENKEQSEGGTIAEKGRIRAQELIAEINSTQPQGGEDLLDIFSRQFLRARSPLKMKWWEIAGKFTIMDKTTDSVLIAEIGNPTCRFRISVQDGKLVYSDEPLPQEPTPPETLE